MGRETTCRGEGTAGAADGRLLLETDELIFRGPARVRIPFASIRAVSAQDGWLTVQYDGGAMRFEVGADAAKWAERIQRPRGRLDKLGITARSVVSVLGVDDPDFLGELAALGATVSRGRLRKGSTVVMFGVEAVGELARLPDLRGRLDPAGGIWVVHRKGKGAVKDVEIFAAGKAAGLVANKVMRFSDTHSADRLVIPKALRSPKG